MFIKDSQRLSNGLQKRNFSPLTSSNNSNNFSNSFDDDLNYSNTNYSPRNFAKKKQGNKKRKYVEREGDWICSKCNNLNFSFRDICNRCKISKNESIKLKK